MKRTSSILINCATAVFVALILTACGGGGGGSSSGGTAPLSVSITDAPVDGASEVVITFTGVTVQAADGTRTTYPVRDPLTDEPGRAIDLLALGGGSRLYCLMMYLWNMDDIAGYGLKLTSAIPTRLISRLKTIQMRCLSCVVRVVPRVI